MTLIKCTKCGRLKTYMDDYKEGDCYVGCICKEELEK